MAHSTPNEHEEVMMITHGVLRDRFTYNESDGFFYFNKNISNKKSGDIAGSLMPSGYRVIRVFGRRYYAHRLAWLYVYGKWPDNQIDHINGNKDDNRITNLRNASSCQNNQNSRINKSNSSGFKGVSWNKKSKKWRAYCGAFGRQVHIGLFDDINDAAAAVHEFRSRAHNEFANHGDAS